MKGYLSVFVLLVLTFIVSCSLEKIEVKNQKLLQQQVGQQTKIKWLGQWYGEGKKETLIREIAREFAFLNQDIDVELKFPYQAAGIDSFADPFRPTADSIAKWVRTNTWPYDIMVCDKWFYRDVADVIGDNKWGEKYLVDFKNEEWFIKTQKEYVLNVDEYIYNFGGIAPGAFLEGAWNLLYASAEVEEKLGIKVKDHDMTIDDFIEYARTVHNYNQTQPEKITFCAINYISLVTVVDHLVLSDMGNERLNTNADRLAVLSKVYNKLETLAQYMPVEQYHTYSSDRELKHDKTLFHLHSTWVKMFWQRSNPEGEKMMRPCEFPSMPGKISNSYSGTYNAVFVVPQNAKNREAAIRLMEFISSADVAEKWENYSKCPTGLRTRISLNEFGTDGFSFLSQHITQKYNNHLEDAAFSKRLFNNNQSNINFYALEVLNGSLTASKAIENIRRQLN